jgi:hypothetical protein
VAALQRTARAASAPRATAHDVEESGEQTAGPLATTAARAEAEASIGGGRAGTELGGRWWWWWWEEASPEPGGGDKQREHWGDASPPRGGRAFIGALGYALSEHPPAMGGDGAEQPVGRDSRSAEQDRPGPGHLLLPYVRSDLIRSRRASHPSIHPSTRAAVALPRLPVPLARPMASTAAPLRRYGYRLPASVRVLYRARSGGGRAKQAGTWLAIHVVMGMLCICPACCQPAVLVYDI